MLYANTSLFATVCDKDSGAIRTLVDSTSGELDGVFVNKVLPGGYTISLTEGLDDDVWNAVTKLQALCEDFGSRNLPFLRWFLASAFESKCRHDARFEYDD